MTRWLTSAAMMVAAAAVGLQAEAPGAVDHAEGLVHAEPATLVLLGIVLTVAAYQLRRLLGTPRTR